MNLEKRLGEGPLKVRTLWTAEQTGELRERVLRLRRRRLVFKAAFLSTTLFTGVLALVLSLPFVTEQLADHETPRGASNLEHAEVGTPVSIEQGRGEIALEDGSRIRFDAKTSDVSLLQVSEARVTASLSRGRADFSIARKKGRVFEVVAGILSVEVLGTAFSVSRQGEGAEVRVTEGRVRLRWPGSEVELRAGESGRFPPEPLDPSEELAGGEAPRVEVVKNSWRDLARSGAHEEAYQLLEKQRLAGGLRNDPADLMLSADVARLSGHPAQAVEPLRAVIGRFSGDPRAPLAAFTLGKVLQESLGRPAQAADAFRRAIELAPNGPLAEDALAREVQARLASGQVERARTLSARYVSLYPEGRQAARLKGLSRSD